MGYFFLGGFFLGFICIFLFFLLNGGGFFFLNGGLFFFIFFWLGGFRGLKGGLGGGLSGGGGLGGFLGGGLGGLFFLGFLNFWLGGGFFFLNWGFLKLLGLGGNSLGRGNLFFIRLGGLNGGGGFCFGGLFLFIIGLGGFSLKLLRWGKNSLFILGFIGFMKFFGNWLLFWFLC